MGLSSKPQQFSWRGAKAVVLCVAFVTVLTACEKNSEIKVYRVSKAPLEEAAPQQQDAMPTNTAAPRMPGGLAPAAQTAVTTPPNWETQSLSQMRQASFLVKGDNGAIADISFVSLGSAAGNVLENVNRWLGQIGQPPVTEQKLDEIAQRLHTSFGDVAIVDLFLDQGNGLGVVDACRQRAAHQKVLVVSNYATPDVRARSKASNCLCRPTSSVDRSSR